mgnify:CR=1 FL=1|jgi:ubiquinone/menaquinone biosynthesis C-methylase UbiE
MPQIGNFDTDSDALVRRVSAHTKYGNAELNDWIFSSIGLSGGLDVLDLGCGFGKQSLPMLSMGCKVTAVDASLESLEFLRSTGDGNNLKIIHSNFDEVELPNTFFDAVVSSYAFYYSHDSELLLRKIFEKMKDGAKIFICGPSFQNNMGMKNLLKKIGVNFGEGSAPFMENEAPKLFEKVFGNVERLVFKNVISFPSAEAVWDYWSSHNMFNASVEENFKNELALHFSENDSFETTKVALGLLSTK